MSKIREILEDLSVNLNEMVTICYIPVNDYKGKKIQVYSNKGPIPHFHVKKHRGIMRILCIKYLWILNSQTTRR